MSFADVDDVIEIQEGYLKKLFKELMDVEIETPLPRLSWREAMERYGSDKPDTRFGFELRCINELDVIKNTEFQVFGNALKNGGDVRGIRIENRYPRRNILISYI